MKTKAIRLQEHGGPEVLQLVEVDVGDPGPDEVRVRNHAIGVNFIDIYYRTGLYAAQLPHGIGTEGAGVVEAVGSNVKFLKEGDRVSYAQGPLGAYAEVRTMAAATAVRLPKKISFEEGAAVTLKGLTVQYLFRQVYRLQGDETILFHAAAGGVGLIACQWARALGVKLIGTVSSPEKAALAKEHGAWQTIDYSKEDFAERVKELTQGKKVPVVYDGVGKDTWEKSLDCIERRGLMVNFGNASGPVTGVNLGILAQKGSLYVTRPTLATFVTPRSLIEASAEELFDLVVKRKIVVNVAQRYPLAEAGRAQADIEARKTTGSTVLLP
ncbi:MAG TPA: quinone oxidoreductase [Burkholderiaceae bacterium]|nr:quinone oxidoreductase [Burkholderiaceae bacterium]